MTTDDERKAQVAGDISRPLDADESADLSLLVELLGDESTWISPPTELESAVLADIDALASAAADAPVLSRRRARRQRFFSAAVGVAATVAIVVGLTFAHGGGHTDFTAHLSATELAPGARGSAAIKRNEAGFRVVLDAHGLPVLPTGQYYQAWLKDAGGQLVPIGTFSSDNGSVTLWSGVSPAQFPTMSVTIEAPDGNQNSSGRRVLVGPVTSN